jgi:hypothetical protein
MVVMALTTAVRSTASSLPSSGDHAARPAVEVGKGRAAFRGQCELGDAAVGPRRLARDNLAPLQGLQGAAEESGIETQRADQLGGGAALPFRDFVNDPRFLQRPGAVQQLRLDDAQFSGVKSAEAADRRDLAIQFGSARHV